MKVLVTAGGTDEPIDAVRYIGNVSTGATGLAIVNHLRSRGHKVHFLHHHRIEHNTHTFSNSSFRTFEELQSGLQEALSEHFFDGVIHAAAVSDYRVSAVTVDGRRRELRPDEKLSSAESLDLHLKARPKLLESLKAWSRNPEVVVVAFKLTSQLSEPEARQSVQALLDRGKADLVVHNDVAEVGQQQHKATVFGVRGIVASTQTKAALAEFVVNWLRLRRTM